MTDQDTLELMIDRLGLAKVYEMIINICEDKAEHINTTWQDEVTAEAWTREGEQLSDLVIRV